MGISFRFHRFIFFFGVDKGDIALPKESTFGDSRAKSPCFHPVSTWELGSGVRMEIIYVLRWKSHLYYSERNLIIDNDSGRSNLFTLPRRTTVSGMENSLFTSLTSEGRGEQFVFEPFTQPLT